LKVITPEFWKTDIVNIVKQSINKDVTSFSELPSVLGLSHMTEFLAIEFCKELKIHFECGFEELFAMFKVEDELRSYNSLEAEISRKIQNLLILSASEDEMKSYVENDFTYIRNKDVLKLVSKLSQKIKSIIEYLVKLQDRRLEKELFSASE
jgi:hypothetical protein